ncbi:GTP-binding protein [Streptomyces pseudovenezuelae]|uniref:Signal recognition particle receptor subunit beta n=1 Tax=Streptomyces pseudovenezuelae TaxID=67350 RepID=A0ABT6LYX6_9ACTN|nr:ATP/GTP-binding protein [Streptomyces pseudovenezuelae]MDH6221493.1 signal recognition particle receptor subunit beta [Streptomyces pseudovenezuelae]
MTQPERTVERERIKLVIGGGFGVGKTTAIGAVSDIDPLKTEEVLTTRSAATDSLHGVENKTHTTVAFDFGRVGWDGPDPVELYLFGAPGQLRFWSLWHDLCDGASGAVVLADTRRIESSFHAADFFEHRGLPFVIAVNTFPGTKPRTPDDIRDAFSVKDTVPLMFCDARDGGSVASVLVTLFTHILKIRYPDLTPLDA